MESNESGFYNSNRNRYNLFIYVLFTHLFIQLVLRQLIYLFLFYIGNNKECSESCNSATMAVALCGPKGTVQLITTTTTNFLLVFQLEFMHVILQNLKDFNF